MSIIDASDSYPYVNLNHIKEIADIDFDFALARLVALYQTVDYYLEETTTALNLPCKKGCADCCKESIFLTPLEFYAVWMWLQENLESNQIELIIKKGLALYFQHKESIDAFNIAPKQGEKDHFYLAKDLHFDCPFLTEKGDCLVYPIRELFARLFGGVFDPNGDIYGCHLVRQHLLGKEVTLLPIESPIQQLQQLPLTYMRQVYPYYINLLYG